MNDNLTWLFAAFSTGWAILFAYLVWISRKQRTLSKRIAELQALLEPPADSRL